MASQPPGVGLDQIAAIQQTGHVRQMLAASDAATAEESLVAVQELIATGADLDPILTYTGDLLTRIDYADGSYKALTYGAGLLTQIDHVRGEKTTRKTLSYLGGRLVSVVQTTLTGV